MLERVKIRSGLPLILKGVTTVDDARLAIEHGVRRHLHLQPWRSRDRPRRGTIQVLPRIVDAIEGKAEVIIDGGFVRGSDVLKAISLGARAVCMGGCNPGRSPLAGSRARAQLEILERKSS